MATRVPLISLDLSRFREMTVVLSEFFVPTFDLILLTRSATKIRFKGVEFFILSIKSSSDFIFQTLPQLENKIYKDAPFGNGELLRVLTTFLKK